MKEDEEESAMHTPKGEWCPTTTTMTRRKTAPVLSTAAALLIIITVHYSSIPRREDEIKNTHNRLLTEAKAREREKTDIISSLYEVRNRSDNASSFSD